MLHVCTLYLVTFLPPGHALLEKFGFLWFVAWAEEIKPLESYFAVIYLLFIHIMYSIPKSWPSLNPLNVNFQPLNDQRYISSFHWHQFHIGQYDICILGWTCGSYMYCVLLNSTDLWFLFGRMSAQEASEDVLKTQKRALALHCL